MYQKKSSLRRRHIWEAFFFIMCAMASVLNAQEIISPTGMIEQKPESAGTGRVSETPIGATVRVDSFVKVDASPSLQELNAVAPPVLISPPDSAMLDNGRTDFRDVIVWDFDWAEVPEATQYNLYVINMSALFPVINVVVSASSYHHEKVGYIVEAYRFNWTWKVRAMVNGVWESFSDIRTFYVEPVNTDPPFVSEVVADFVGTPLLGVTPLTVKFTDKSTGDITSWRWNFGDGGISTMRNPIHTYSVDVDPKFTVSLTVTGAGGSDTEIKFDYIQVLLSAEVSFDAYPASGMAPLSTRFKVNSNLQVLSYAWNFGDGNTSTEASPEHTYEKPGMFTVGLVVNTPLGRIAVNKKDFITAYECFLRADLKLVSATPAYPGEGWDNAIDDDIDNWNGTVTAEGNPPQAIFGFADEEMRMIDRVRLLTDTNVGLADRWVKAFRVLISTTGTAETDFTEIFAGTKIIGGWEDFTFSATAAKYVKFVVDHPVAGFRQLGELEVWETDVAAALDTAAATVSVTSPHVADSIDAAKITIVLKKLDGNPFSGVPAHAFTLLVSGRDNVLSEVTETATPGTYSATLISHNVGVKTITALVGCARVWRDINGQAAAVVFNPMPLHQADLVFVSGSETYPDEGWDNATDGDVDGWDGTVTTTGDSAFAVFAFAGNATERVAKVGLCTDTGVGFGSRWVTRFQILVSTTGTAEGDFTPVLASELKGGDWREFEFSPAEAKYVKLRIEIPASGWRQLGEFEVHLVGSGLAKPGGQECGAPAGVPKEFSFSQNYPNPFNPETMIQFGLPVASEIRLAVYDMQGRLVRRLVENVLPAGLHTIRWDGNDAAGAPVASGIYFCRLQAGNFSQVKKMSLVR